MRLRSLLKQVGIFSIVGLLAFSLVGCGQSKKEVLVVGLDDTFAPMGFKDENGEIVGFDIDLAKAVGEKMGKEMKFQSIDWSMKEAELNAKNIDFIWNGYSITDERKEQVAFGTPYLKNRQIIITLADSPINTKADLKDKVVGAQTGSTAVDAIETEPEVLATFKDGKPVTYETNNDVLMDLEAGRLDAVVADEIIVKYYISKKGAEKYKILDEDFGEEEYGVGMRKEDTALVEAFNKAYAELKQEGKLAEISNTWFGEDITQ
ncbi:amino acid ABC transporter substrate-binding protein [Cellulosilyticum sp. WCF-2]|uniref:amino acid ABC transporter substrate-binding protein n=1 Tax=Cellulosilyticum sp. WCF-2 TaxID=2497860 RepID=UPI000F8C77D7|nr:amino acid ABC transporter substrate-binding protein [Cellulosilyticum sp. WCF-2]QEH67312.1 amino acid ABC transporter substrate-binding protein [Cellulosilyticum sp. WCF-2]